MDKWWEGVRFELALQLRRPTVWVMGGLFLFPLVGVTLDRFQRAGGGDILFGAPLQVAQGGVVIGLVAMLIVAAVAGEAATRDVRTRLEPLMHAAPVGKATYLGSRFCASLGIAAALFAAGPLAHVLVPLTDPALAREIVGPSRPAAYLGTYLLFLLPNAFVATAAAFGGATLMRHSLGGWVGILLLVFASQASHSWFGDILGRWDVAQALDPSGATTLDYLAQTWTLSDARTRLIGLTGPLLWNRVIWLGAAGGLLLLAYRRFDFGAHASASRSWHRGILGLLTGRLRTTPGPAAERTDPAGAPGGWSWRDHAPGPFGTASRIRQTGSIVRDSLRELAPPWLWGAAPALVALQYFLTVTTLETMGAGTPVSPTTTLVFRSLLPGAGDMAPPIALAIVLIPILMAGELVWREREAHMAGLADAAPVPAGVWFAGKVAGLWLVIFALFALIATGGILAQVRLGGADLDPLLLGRLLGLRMVRPLLFALFAFSIHVIVSRKHLAHVITLFLVVPLMGELLGIQHPLLLIGWGPDWHYSPIRGFGPFLSAVLWFDLYWGGWALLMAFVARLFWVRGVDPGGVDRARVALARFRRAGVAPFATALGLVGVSGSVIVYNLHVLNPYRTATDVAAVRADYERHYAHIKGSPQPSLVGTQLQVELFPDRGEARVAGVHRLENRTGRRLDTLYVASSLEVETRRLTFDRPARMDFADEGAGHRAYVLDESLAPGDSLRLEWEVEYKPRGFSSQRMADSQVALNGSMIRMRDWMPLMGYRFDRELPDPRVRREMGLPPATPLPPPDGNPPPVDRFAREQVDVSVTVGTTPDQIAAAPGTLRRMWSENGRAYFRYQTSAPIGTGYAVFSARYSVATGRWRDVAVQVLHHPEHDANVGTMIRSMEASLRQLTERFGTYPHRTLRMVEYPSEGGSLHAASGTIWYQELFSHFDSGRDPQQIDLPFAVVAHEVAHQFQPVPARMEGQALLSESFAWYAALGVIEEEYGERHLQRVLRFMRRSYLTPRSRADVPLLRANDAFLGYRKGPFAMYALREYVGQDRVDVAWRRLRARHATHEPPFATSLDLYRELQQVTPEPLQSLLGDLLERNTYWDLEAKRVTAAETGTGSWQVSIDVEALKSTVDTAGAETMVPMDDLVEIGVYASDPSEAPLYLEQHRIRSGPQTLFVTVSGRPARAGIDPRHLLIDVEPGNNVLPISQPPLEGS